MQSRETILVGAVRTNTGLEQSPDLFEVVPGRGLQQHDRRLEDDPAVLDANSFGRIRRRRPVEVSPELSLTLGPTTQLLGSTLLGKPEPLLRRKSFGGEAIRPDHEAVFVQVRRRVRSFQAVHLVSVVAAAAAAADVTPLALT